MPPAKISSNLDERPRVYVVDDDEQVRRTLGRILRADYDVVCFAAAQQFLDVVSALKPGCLVLDVYMPDIDGLEVQRCLDELNLRFPTVMITGAGELRIAVKAMKAGAVDFVEKPFTPDVIAESVRLAHRRLIPAEPDDSADVAKERLARLSPRESEVLAGLVAGLPNKTIAYDLGLSPRTVEMHRANLMKKMEASSLSALVRMALAAGLPART